MEGTHIGCCERVVEIIVVVVDWKSRWEPKAGWLRARATEKFIERLKPPAKGSIDFKDRVVPNLRLQVRASGYKVWVLSSRFPGTPGGNPTRRALGQYGALTIDGAREKARTWIALIGKGIDPAVHEAQERAENKLKQSESFGVVAEEFLKRYAPTISHQKECEDIIRKDFVSRWRDRPFASLTPHEARDAILAVAERGKYQARSAHAHLRRMLSWARGNGYSLPQSPLDGLSIDDLVGKKEARSRTLSDAEIRQVWRSTYGMGYPRGPFIQLLLLTGQRRDEVAGVRWREINLDQKLWTIPADRMKGGRAHEVPLSDAAVVLLEGLPRWKSSDFVLSPSGKNPLTSHTKTKASLDKFVADVRAFDGVEEPMERWTFHDLRRTMRTHLSALPIQDLVRELTIAHARPGLHRIYDLHGYRSEKAEAMRLWEQRLFAILAPPRPAEVVSIAKARAKRK